MFHVLSQENVEVASIVNILSSDKTYIATINNGIGDYRDIILLFGVGPWIGAMN